MKLLTVERSTRPAKKWMATFCDCAGGKTTCKPSSRRVVHFGATGYEDYTMHHDKERRRRYRARHAQSEDAALDTPGALSYHLLWGESTSLETNLSAYKRKMSC